MTKVFVSCFSPARLDGGIGGFEWSTDRALMETSYEHHEAEAKANGAHIVRLVEIEVESDVDDWGATTDEIDGRIEEVESLNPAIRQYVPPTTPPELHPRDWQ